MRHARLRASQRQMLLNSPVLARSPSIRGRSIDERLTVALFLVRQIGNSPPDEQL
jgi:hypothetical protein